MFSDPVNFIDPSGFVAVDEVSLITATGDLISLAKDRMAIAGKSNTLITYSWVLFGTGANTYKVAIRDIRQFRIINGHIVDSQGSLIPWHKIQIDWNQYGAKDKKLTHEEIFEKFLKDIKNLETNEQMCKG